MAKLSVRRGQAGHWYAQAALDHGVLTETVPKPIEPQPKKAALDEGGGRPARA